MRRHRKAHKKYSRLSKLKRMSFLALGALLCAYLSGYIPTIALNPAHSEVWHYIEQHAPDYDLNPEFVYAIARAESSLKPNALTFYARGIMQLSRAAWQSVSHEPYRRAWNWRLNLKVGMKYLHYCKIFLEQHHAFNEANLAAAYRYGPNALKKAKFNAQALGKNERNKIYQELFRSK